MRTKRIAYVCILLLFTTTAYNNCSKTQFGTAQDNNESLDDGRVQEVLEKCEEHRRNGTLQSTTPHIVFDPSKQETGRNEVCLFEQNGNGAEHNGFQAARHDQKRYLQLPAGAELCDLEFEMQTQTFTYDDMFYLSMNGTVISSSNASAVKDLPVKKLKVAGKSISIYQYNWASLFEKPFQNEEKDDYCLGRSQGFADCQWPKTQQTGGFKLEFEPELLVRLGLKSEQSTHELMFTVTGDDDNIKDCAHSGFEFDLKASYYIP